MKTAHVAIEADELAAGTLARLRHRPHCTSPALVIWGDDTKTMFGCDGCHVAMILRGSRAEQARRITGLPPAGLTTDREPSRTATPEPKPEPVDQTEEPEPVVTDPRVITWWCREHDRRVSHHGRDCPKCRAEHAQREAGRRRARRERAEARAEADNQAQHGRPAAA